MLKLATDENFNGYILSGLLSRKPDLDIVRVQDTEMYESNDPDLLAWAAHEGRILLTHDVNTLTGFAYERVRTGQPMPGVFQVAQNASIGDVIEDILLLVEASFESEWEGQVRYIPLRPIQ
jgi:predicted nuclease of predicted toxin-antitoxin system